MKHLLLYVALATCGLLVACGEQGTDPALTNGATASPEDPAATQPDDASAVGGDADPVAAPTPVLAEGSPIWFEPDRIDDCAKGVAGVIHWDASSFPGVPVVKVVLPAEDGSESVFAVAGAVGEKETGPWLVAGSEVILRDTATDEELARARMPGAACEG